MFKCQPEMKTLLANRILDYLRELKTLPKDTMEERANKLLSKADIENKACVENCIRSFVLVVGISAELDEQLKAVYEIDEGVNLANQESANYAPSGPVIALPAS